VATSGGEPGIRLLPTDMPAVFRAADARSAQAQQRFTRTILLQLALLLVASVAGSLHGSYSGADWLGFAAAGGFLAVALLRLHGLVGREQEGFWYEARATAESAKTLAWRYAVGAPPFQGQDGAEVTLVGRLREVIIGSGPAVAMLPDADAVQITPAMRRLRECPLDVRRAVYCADRIDEQRRWYTTKAQQNQSRSQHWGLAFLALDGLAISGSVLLAIDAIDVNLIGVAGTAATAVTAWVQLRQHATLARAYSVAAHELSLIRLLLDQARTEEEWSRFVDDAEKAISREHTLWRASRSAAQPAVEQ